MLLEMRNITKRFPGVLALDNVDFDLDENEVHVLAGENGAGKSTLVKVIAGVNRGFSGNIFLNGKEVDVNSPKDSQRLGISIIYQEFNLIPYFTIAENIFLGREPISKRIPGKIMWDKMFNDTKLILHNLEVDISPYSVVNTLGVAKMQIVEIAKALSVESKIIIMDEPTAALSVKEIETLFRTIKKLKESGVSIIYISHRLEEYKEVGDRVTVMRDGRKVKTLKISETNRNELIKLMVGRELKALIPKVDVKKGDEAFRVTNLNRVNILKNINFSISKGEILGIAGLMGAGKTEIARAIFGLDKKDSGDIYLNGKKIKINNPADAIKSGIGFITEDRKNEGLILPLSVGHNISMACLDNFTLLFHLNSQKERETVSKYVKKLAIRTPSLEQRVLNLSGGNQQKTVIAKWLMTKSKVLIFDEPTRGIDVGAKTEVYKLINELVADGAAILLISSELPEIIGICDRVLVVYRGEIIKSFSREDFDQEDIVHYATGGIKVCG